MSTYNPSAERFFSGKRKLPDRKRRLPPPSPPYTTVASIIQNLKRKGYVRIEREGNGYRYLPVVSEAEYKRTFLSGFVQEYFRNSYKELVSFFARDQKLSGDDLKDILRMIEEEKDK